MANLTDALIGVAVIGATAHIAGKIIDKGRRKQKRKTKKKRNTFYPYY